MVRKLKKDIKSLAEAGLIGAGLGIGLGAIGGNVAARGQEGIQGATSFLPAIGTVVGAAALINFTDKALNPKPSNKKKIIRRRARPSIF